MPTHLKLLLAILGFHLVWLALVLATYRLNQAVKRCDISREPRKYALLARAANFLYGLYLLSLPAVLCSFWLIDGLLKVFHAGQSQGLIQRLGLSPNQFNATVGALLLSHLLLWAPYLLIMHRKRSRDSSSKPPGKSRGCFLPYLLVALVITIFSTLFWAMIANSTVGWLALIGLIIAGVISATVKRFRREVIKRSKNPPGLFLEHCPLRHEVDRICAQLNQRWSRIQVVVERPSRSAKKTPRNRASDLMYFSEAGFDLDAPAIPLFLFQLLNPAALTAYLSLIVLRRKVAAGQLRKESVGSNVAFALGMAAIVLLAIIAGVVFIFVDQLISQVVCFGILGSLAAFFIIVMLAILRRKKRKADQLVMHRAMQAWRGADPRAQRTPKQFLLCLLEIAQVLNPEFSREQVAVIQLRDPKTATFLKRFNPAERQRLLTAKDAWISGEATAADQPIHEDEARDWG